jgi:hypothetical protein
MQRVIDMEAHAALMRFAFEQICNKDDWKEPVDCVVPWTTANLYGQAITFMTATAPVYGTPYLHEGQQMVRITADGYRAGPAN